MQSHRIGRRTLVALVLGTLVLGACSSGSDDAGDEPANSAAPAESAEGAPGAVTMRLIAFRPSTVSVAPGEAVTWTQEDAGVHTVTSGVVEQQSGGVKTVPDGRFDSGQLATGKTFSTTLAAPGTYPYFCAIHPATMRGEIQVA